MHHIQRNTLAILTLIFLAAQARAQSTDFTLRSAGGNISRPVAFKRPQPIRHETSFGLRLNTDGWSAFIDRGNIQSNEGKQRDQFYNVRVFTLELAEHKDPKEEKRAISEQTTGGGSDKTKPFIFGKINNFYALKLGVSDRHLIAGKPEQGTVSIHWVNTGGFALGMEKPYYLDGFVQDNTGTFSQETFKYTDGTKGSFLNPANIRGGAGFAKGLNEITFVPGIYAKTGLHFDFSNSRYRAMALETGISAEYYSKPIIIMAGQDAKPYFVNLYVAFQLGWRK